MFNNKEWTRTDYDEYLNLIRHYCQRQRLSPADRETSNRYFLIIE